MNVVDQFAAMNIAFGRFLSVGSVFWIIPDLLAQLSPQLLEQLQAGRYMTTLPTAGQPSSGFASPWQ